MRGGLRDREAALVFRAALGLAVLLTAALVGVLLTPAGADAEAAAAYHTLLWVLQVWTVLAWAVVVVVGLRGRSRR
jgi:hypothetical protein